MRAVVLDAFGGPEALTCQECPEPEPRDGEVLVDVTLAGVNFSDTRLRTLGMQSTVDAGGRPNWLAAEDLPVVPGAEVVGTVDGRRVVALCGVGGYAERVVAPVERVFDVPDDVGDADALSLFVQGLTAWLALRRAARLEPRESVVVQSAAGGVGSLAVQIARELGAAAVVGVASTEDKRALVTRLGATGAVAGGDGLTERLLEANGGGGYHVAIESGGAPEFDRMLAAMARFGRLVTLGTASGAPGQVVTAALIAGSRSVVGFWLVDHLRERDEAERAVRELFELAARKAITPLPITTFALEDAAGAHRLIESRTSTGKVALAV